MLNSVSHYLTGSCSCAKSLSIFSTSSWSNLQWSSLSRLLCSCDLLYSNWDLHTHNQWARATPKPRINTLSNQIHRHSMWYLIHGKRYLLAEVRVLCSSLLCLPSESSAQLLDSSHSLLHFLHIPFALCGNEKDAQKNVLQCQSIICNSKPPLMCSSISFFSWACKYFTVSEPAVRSPLCTFLFGVRQVCQINAQHGTRFIMLEKHLFSSHSVKLWLLLWTCLLSFIFFDSSLLFSQDWFFTTCLKDGRNFSFNLIESLRVTRKLNNNEQPAGLGSALLALLCTERHFPPATSSRFSAPRCHLWSSAPLLSDTSDKQWPRLPNLSLSGPKLKQRGSRRLGDLVDEKRVIPMIKGLWVPVSWCGRTYPEGWYSRWGPSCCFPLRHHLGGKGGSSHWLRLHVAFGPQPSPEGRLCRGFMVEKKMRRVVMVSVFQEASEFFKRVCVWVFR